MPPFLFRIPPGMPSGQSRADEAATLLLLERLLGLAPYLAIALLLGLLAGITFGWVARKAGRNPWEATLCGLGGSFICAGFLVTVLALVAAVLGAGS